MNKARADEACEVNGAAVVACSEAAEMLEATEASLDLVAMLVNDGVVEDEDFAISLDQITAWDSMLAIHSHKVIAFINFDDEAGPDVMRKRNGRPNMSPRI